MGSFFGTLSDFCHTIHMAIFGKLFYNLYLYRVHGTLQRELEERILIDKS